MRHSQIWMMDADENYAEPVRTALAEQGAHVHDFSDIGGIKASLAGGPQPTLILMDADAQSGAAIDLVAALRQRQIGRSNPFTMVVLTSWNGDAENLQMLNRSGADAVLIKPYSTDDVLKTIQHLAGHVRQYMACQDYLGPVQDGIGPKSMKVMALPVPNDFQLLARDMRVSPQMIEEAWQRLTVERARLDTGFVVDDFNMELETLPAEDIEAWAEDLSARCKDAAVKLKETPLQASQCLVEVGGDFTESIARDGFRHNSADGKIVNQLAVAMQISGQNRPEDLPFARQIAADMHEWLSEQEEA